MPASARQQLRYQIHYDIGVRWQRISDVAPGLRVATWPSVRAPGQRETRQGTDQQHTKHPGFENMQGNCSQVHKESPIARRWS